MVESVVNSWGEVEIIVNQEIQEYFALYLTYVRNRSVLVDFTFQTVRLAVVYVAET